MRKGICFLRAVMELLASE